MKELWCLAKIPAAMRLQRGDLSPRLLGHMCLFMDFDSRGGSNEGGAYSTKMTTSFRVGMSIEVETYGKPLDTENLLCEISTSVYFKHFKLHILKTETKSKLNI